MPKRFWRGLAWGLPIALVLWAGIIAGARLALAHSWYPQECCSDRDCWPMGPDADAREPDPTIVPGGYRTHDGHFIAQRDTRPSRDGRFHICRAAGAPGGDPIRPSGKPACLFAPEPAT
ncbi:hypothetical protein [Bosea sp. (in: a-proteobacteria)]|uniref:hypothetical protein n=1 Tax=Bosea sp. (in: a-proteobacteria) TaxID=1871050 RepID=UPI002734518B|nr:hypothetical protein [Bosea sp. (in: a-proteobacteria)]MDP3411143.1 hypothetical protein [Bosea sp. (in: a-proteobacteria)]